MASTPCISPSQRRALSNPTSLPPLAFIPPNLQELPKDQHALKLYRQMLSKAHIPRNHLEYVQDLSKVSITAWRITVQLPFQFQLRKPKRSNRRNNPPCSMLSSWSICGQTEANKNDTAPYSRAWHRSNFIN